MGHVQWLLFTINNQRISSPLEGQSIPLVHDFWYSRPVLFAATRKFQHLKVGPQDALQFCLGRA